MPPGVTAPPGAPAGTPVSMVTVPSSWQMPQSLQHELASSVGLHRPSPHAGIPEPVDVVELDPVLEALESWDEPPVDDPVDVVADAPPCPEEPPPPSPPPPPPQ